jgi:hypothetical protein
MALRLAALTLLLICRGVRATEVLVVGRAREREQIELDVGVKE